MSDLAGIIRQRRTRLSLTLTPYLIVNCEAFRRDAFHAPQIEFTGSEHR